jgi:tetratricopeptide (TPR) repeat protein
VLETIPAETPYITASPERVAALAPLFGGDEVKVGLVWGGNPRHPYDRYRSIPLSSLQPLLDTPGTRFFSLQLGPRQAELGAGFAARIVDLSPHIADFADTAAALSQLDLVIAVDTAVAHLAGALGKPVWMMLPASADWRWLLQRSDSPWYPSLRLFRQPARGDWTPVVDRLLPSLLERVAEMATVRPETLNNLGLRLRRLGRFAAATQCFRRAIEARPNYPLAYNNLGLTLQDQGKLDEGIAAHRQAVTLKPNYADGHNNLAVALDRAEKPDEATVHYRKALSLQPDHPEALTNYGNALRLAGRLDEAIAVQRRSLQVRPDHPDALNNLGFSLKTKGDLAEATQCFRGAVAARPDFVAGHVNLAMALLTQGEFVDGAAEYEWRWRGYQGTRLPDLSQPLWNGEVLGKDKTLMLWAEQGLGDTIQFIRYAPLLRRFAGRIMLCCQPALKTLMQSAAGVDAVVAAGGELPSFDAYLPLMSVMQRLGTALDTIPAAIPYLAADADRMAALAHRFGGPDLKVGLVWSGNPKHGNDRHRSLPLASLRPLLGLHDVRFFSLQIGPRAADIAAEGLASAIVDLAPDLHDFADTAAAISLLDLVISVDTSVAHLAGALGRPTWTLLPSNADWRWLTGRSDTPWYPSMLLFRQPTYGVWAPVVEQIAVALATGLLDDAGALSERTARR